MHRIDQGHKVLDEISKTYGELHLANANEAETRLKLIDQVISRVLGWEREDLSVEERVTEDGSTVFADYILRTASTAILIESKKVGVAFTLPSNRLTLELGGVLSEGSVGKAIRQARDYCRKKSVPFATVTNGSVWIVFPAVRTDQVTFENSTAHIFRSLNDIRKRFVEFWELLSKERVLDGNIASVLLGSKAGETGSRCLRNNLPEPDYRLGRNALYDHIEPAVAIALSDDAILQDRSALEACYIKTAARLKFDQRLNVYLKDPMPPLGHSVTRLRARKGEEKLVTTISRSTTLTQPRFILLLGPVGSGKTTFLHYTRKISAAHAIDSKIMWLYIDFRTSTSSDRPSDFIYRQLLELIERDIDFDLGDWRKSVRPAYGEVIDGLRRGPLNPLWSIDKQQFELKVGSTINAERDKCAPYVDRILKYASTKRLGYLIIDNVDQLDDQDHQSLIFLETQAIARRIGFSVILSLRESTYLRHKDSPSFNAFQLDSFYLDPPSVLPVLSRRFAYARKVLEGRSASLRTEQGFTISVPNLSSLFDIVAKSVLDQKAGQMIEVLAGGNIRRGLGLVRSFLSSGHTNADHAATVYLTHGDYHFPVHEVFRGAVLGASRYYNEGKASLPNIFDSKLGSHRLQLLRLALVDFLVTSSGSVQFDGLRIREVNETMSRLGVSSEAVDVTVRTLVNTGLLRTGDGLAISPDSVLIPTRLAAYVVRELSQEFVYSEMCLLDTAIFDDDTWNKILLHTDEAEKASSIADAIAARCNRIRVFFDDLERAEERWSVECNRRRLPPEWSRQIVSRELRPALENNLKKVIRSAEHQHRRSKRAQK